MKQRAAFGPYEPDKAPFGSAGLIDMGNAYPGANGYRPVGAFAALTPVLPAAFMGGAAFVDSGGNGTQLAGTAAALYRYSAGDWVSLATGLTTAGRWQFTQFGDKVIAVNGATTKSVNLTAQTVATLSGAPTAKSVATVRDFVVYGAAAGQDNLIQWSAFNNETGNTPGTDQAGYQPMLDGGSVQGLAGGEYGLIIQRSRIVKMTYIGLQTDGVTLPFQFDVIAPNVGAITGNSIAQAGRQVFFLSDRGFMTCDGTDVTPIGTERVNKYFFDRFPRQQLPAMYTAIDPRRNIVAWLMPGSAGVMLVYDWALDKWAKIELNLDAIFSGFTANTSLEELDALYPGGLETIPYSLDDPRFAGGDPLLIVVYNNAVGTLAGANVAAWFETGEAQLVDTGRARVAKVRPLIDATTGLTLTLKSKTRLGDAATQGVFTSLQASGEMPVRANGRYVAARLDIAAGSAWANAQGLEYLYENGGSR